MRFQPRPTTVPSGASASNPKPRGGALVFALVFALVVAGGLFPRRVALAFEPELDDWFALEAARPFGTRLGSAAEAGYVDATIETGNTGSKELDQRYFAGARADVAYSPAPAVSFRAFARGVLVDTLRQDSLAADRSVRSKETRLNGALDASFSAAQGIEVFLGSAVAHTLGSRRTVKLPAVESTTEFAPATVYAPRLGLLKRANAFAAGLYYGLLAEEERSYERTTGLDEDRGREWVTVPSILGGTARFTFGKDFELESDLALVQLGESEEKTEQGAPLYRDYFRIRFGALFPLGAWGLGATLTHRTLSYDDQGFMTMETIPATRLDARVVTLGQGARAWAGFGFTYGTDAQSIPELNADFSLKTYALNLGIEVPM